MTAPSKKPHPKFSLKNQTKIDTLNRIKIVLVNTTLPANIGSAARAMYTMGLTDLTVVDPKRPIDDSSISHAAGAQQVLENCQVVSTIDEAISSSHIVFAASSRQRHIPKPVINPSQAAQIILNHSIADASFAILFGREDRGLTNDELALADYHIQIDANPDYPVLNVASAVQVISSFIYSALMADSHPTDNEFSDDITHLLPLKQIDQFNHADHENSEYDATNSTKLPTIDVIIRQNWDVPAINHDQKMSLQSRIINLMHQLDLVDNTQHDKLNDLPYRLSRLVSRLQLDQKEYELLNAIIAKINLKL